MGLHLAVPWSDWTACTWYHSCPHHPSREKWAPVGIPQKHDFVTGIFYNNCAGQTFLLLLSTDYQPITKHNDLFAVCPGEEKGDAEGKANVTVSSAPTENQSCGLVSKGMGFPFPVISLET